MQRIDPFIHHHFATDMTWPVSTGGDIYTGRFNINTQVRPSSHLAPALFSVYLPFLSRTCPLPHPPIRVLPRARAQAPITTT